MTEAFGPGERSIFPKAPIVEAIWDIRAMLPSEVDLSHLEKYHDVVREDFPNKRQREFWEARVQFKPGGNVGIGQPTGGPDGYTFSSLDKRQIVQARLDGFTFNKLRPYDKWETFHQGAKKLWLDYVALVQPHRITRIALRYINRIEIPLPIKDFKDYITTVPEIAPGLPQELATYFMQLKIPVPTASALAIITQTLEPVRGEPQLLPMIFDIDVIHEDSYAVEDDQIWESFRKLHELKNSIFFGSITDRTKELFR